MVSHKKFDQIIKILEQHKNLDNEETFKETIDQIASVLNYNKANNNKPYTRELYENYQKKYVEKNREKINELKRIRYHKKKNQNQIIST